MQSLKHAKSGPLKYFQNPNMENQTRQPTIMAACDCMFMGILCASGLRELALQLGISDTKIKEFTELALGLRQMYSTKPPDQRLYTQATMGQTSISKMTQLKNL